MRYTYKSLPLFLKTVTVHRVLNRTVKTANGMRFQSWVEEMPDVEPMQGVIIGERMLSNGSIEANGKSRYESDESFKAYLIVLDPRRAPIYALKSSVTVCENATLRVEEVSA